jgi:maltose alpha-D-glucosyltransferase / alpha-amylase
MNVQELPWFKNAIFYEVYVRAYRDSNADGHGDLRGLTRKTWIISRTWAVNCIWLLPVFPSPLLDDGYDIADYYNVHPDFGDLGRFQNPIGRSPRSGLRVITDLVVNHTSDQHPWFQAARRRSAARLPRLLCLERRQTRSTRKRASSSWTTENSNWTWDELAGALLLAPLLFLPAGSEL